MIFISPAKVNLGLKITGKDPADGYHTIESVFDPVSLYDIIDIAPKSGKNVEIIDCFGALNIPQEKNIMYKAVKLIFDEYHVKKGIKITLYKYIPNGAGLGGGSSNAATVIKAVNILYDLHMTAGDMVKIGYKCGSDVPFFIKCRRSLVTGKGNKIREVKDKKLKWYVIAVHKNIRVCTKDAYKWFDEEKNLTKDLSYTNIIYRNSKERQGFLYNDFESVVFGKYPELKEIKESFFKFNCLDASLSGSGSAVYALFDSRRKAFKCCSMMGRDGEGSFVCLAHST
jgi:4-diphosphocytidyl-2-C-methyl-D-erythritol kinase